MPFNAPSRNETVCLVTLGCPKNEVDSETLCRSLQDHGFHCVRDPSSAEVILVNTCAFIRDAVEESIETLTRLAQYKVSGRCMYLIVAGCMVQRYGAKIFDMLPHADLLMGTRIVHAAGRVLADHIDGTSTKKIILYPSELDSPVGPPLSFRTPHVQSVSAYIKVSEGCSNSCAYCTIPNIRGPLKSRPQREIISEARMRASRGALEINLVAQDLAAYGRDMHSRKTHNLVGLVRTLVRIEPIRWIRLLYCHPAHIGEDLIELFGNEDKLCPYMDIPIQHVAPNILASMNRPYDEMLLRRLIERLRTVCPDIALRTTVMVGFPGETEGDFTRLLSFLKETRFDHVGAFCYSHEEGTPAFNRRETLSTREKMLRYRAVMDTQAEISSARNRELVGTLQEVLIEGYHEETPLLLKGRTIRQAPEVDGIVCITRGHIRTQGMATVRITDSHTYDLVGEIVSAR